MDDQKPSTSRGAEGNQASLNEPLKNTQTGCASGDCGGSNSTTHATPETGSIDFGYYLNKWFVGIEQTKCEKITRQAVTNKVMCWLNDEWLSSNTKPQPAPVVTTIEPRPKPLYWWQKEQFIKSRAASARSSDETSSESSDEGAAMEISENGPTEKKIYLDIPSEAPTGYHRKFPKEQKREKTNGTSSSDSGLSLSASPWGSERLTQTSGSKKTSASPSIQSPILEMPENLFLKCKPRPRAMSEPPASRESSPERDFPHCIVSYYANDELLNSSMKPRCSCSAERQSRSLERGQRETHSAERERNTRPAERDGLSRSSIMLSQPELRSDVTNKRQHRRFRSNLRRLFKSEDNFIQKVTHRGHVVYCSCLCIWYKLVREYNKISEGMRLMNRENR